MGMLSERWVIGRRHPSVWPWKHIRLHSKYQADEHLPGLSGKPLVQSSFIESNSTQTMIWCILWFACFQMFLWKAVCVHACVVLSANITVMSCMYMWMSYLCVRVKQKRCDVTQQRGEACLAVCPLYVCAFTWVVYLGEGDSFRRPGQIRITRLRVAWLLSPPAPSLLSPFLGRELN